MILNYPASQAAFAYYLKRKYNIPIFQALGIFIFIVVIDLVWIISLALAGSFFQEYDVVGVDLEYIVRTAALIAYSALFLWLAFWRRWPEKLMGRHIRIPLLERLRTRKVFHIFEKARVWDYIVIAVQRTPIHFTIIISMYVVLLTFHAHIPFTKILGNVPIVFFIGTLPITPGGLGTTNALMVELLHKYLTGPIFEPIIGPTIDEMKRIGPDIVVPMHCTGWNAINQFAKEMPHQFALNTVGTKYVFG